MSRIRGLLNEILGSAIEVVLLAAIGYYAWTWPQLASPNSAAGREATAHHVEPAVL